MPARRKTGRGISSSISKCIAKAMYLENPKHLMIWNRGVGNNIERFLWLAFTMYAPTGACAIAGKVLCLPILIIKYSPPFQITRHFGFFRYTHCFTMYLDIKYITKATYLEKPKRFLIWNGGSSSKIIQCDT